MKKDLIFFIIGAYFSFLLALGFVLVVMSLSNSIPMRHDTLDIVCQEINNNSNVEFYRDSDAGIRFGCRSTVLEEHIILHIGEKEVIHYYIEDKK